MTAGEITGDSAVAPYMVVLLDGHSTGSLEPHATTMLLTAAGEPKPSGADAGLTSIEGRCNGLSSCESPRTPIMAAGSPRTAAKSHLLRCPDASRVSAP